MCFNGDMDNTAVITAPPAPTMVINFDPLPRRQQQAALGFQGRPEVVPLAWSGTHRSIRRQYKFLRQVHKMSPTSARCTIISIIVAVTA